MKGKGFSAITTGIMTGFADGLILQPMIFSKLGVGDDIARIGLGLLSAKIPLGKTFKNIALAEGIIGSFNLGRSISGGMNIFGSTSTTTGGF